MKKNNIVPKIMYSLIAFVQVVLLVAVFVIEYLSDKKAGVMRHLYTRKMQYETTIFSPHNLNIQKMIVIAIGILLLVLALYVILKRKDTFLKIQSILGVVISAALYLVMNDSYFAYLLAYPYFIMVFAIVLVMQIIVIIAALLNKQ